MGLKVGFFDADGSGYEWRPASCERVKTHFFKVGSRAQDTGAASMAPPLRAESLSWEPPARGIILTSLANPASSNMTRMISHGVLPGRLTPNLLPRNC